MTLYSKWEKGKNLTFIAGVVRLICLFFSWITVKELRTLGIGLGDFISRIQGMLNRASIFIDEDALSQAREIMRAYYASCWRWILLLPMAYPVYSLFTTRYNKNISCISCIVAFAVSLVLIICGIKYMNFAAWLYLVASIVFFVGAVLSKPGLPVKEAADSMPNGLGGEPVPQNGTPSMPPEGVQPPKDVQPEDTAQPETPLQENTVFCPQCGTQNQSGSAFCSKCGHPLN